MLYDILIITSINHVHFVVCTRKVSSGLSRKES